MFKLISLSKYFKLFSFNNLLYAFTDKKFSSSISLIFSAESFSDLITKIDSASRLVKLDQQVVEELLEKQEQLDEKVKSLEVKGEEIKKINEDIQKY